MNDSISELTQHRHQGVRDAARWFSWEHLPPGFAQQVSAACGKLAIDLICELPDSPELTYGLRELLKAKDSFVRAAIAATEDGR